VITFSDKDVVNAIDGISKKLRIALDGELQIEYQNGKYPDLLSYEKVQHPSKEIPAIQKYLIGAQTYLNQPCQFYDIFRICRLVIFARILNQALNTILANTENYEPRLEKLREEMTYDAFESVLYEIAVAASYCGKPKVKKVAFINDPTLESPDIQIKSDIGDVYVECKKFDRSVDMVLDLRNAIREKVKPAMDAFAAENQSAVLEISFHTNPQLVSAEFVRELSLESWKARTPIIDKCLTANVILLAKQKLDTFTLFPSPKYFWERYGYREKGEWFGLVSAMCARHANHISVAGSNENLASTWLDEVDYECIVKWKITDKEIIWQQKRLGYTRLFKGLSQLQTRGTNTVLHAWIERASSLGPRQDEMLDFFNRLKMNKRDIFAWIIFNETDLNVSVQGRFDLIEHAHRIRGPVVQPGEPLVSTVFTADDDSRLGIGEFGIGHQLPDIDECFLSA